MAERHREPYVGMGADGARRSAQIDREEADTQKQGSSRWYELIASSVRWDRQADEIEAAAAGRRSEQEQRAALPDDRWTAMIPDPHPPGNCGPLAMGVLPPGVACPTCGIVPDAGWGQEADDAEG